MCMRPLEPLIIEDQWSWPACITRSCIEVTSTPEPESNKVTISLSLKLLFFLSSSEAAAKAADAIFENHIMEQEIHRSKIFKFVSIPYILFDTARKKDKNGHIYTILSCKNID